MPSRWEIIAILAGMRTRLKREPAANPGLWFQAPLLFLTLGLSCAVSTPGCRSLRPEGNSAGESANSEAITSTVPPFATREPERYQAVRIVTFNESSTSGPATERISRVSVARDGEKRREEYFIGDNESVVYLEVPAGRFVLLPTSQVYAEINETTDESARDLSSENAPPSAAFLLGEGYSASTYQKFGDEQVEGRITTKYRVKSNGTNQAAGNFEAFIWIDESLGMPVRSEAISGTSEQSLKATMELKDIKLEVDDHLFVLPPSYQKVDSRLVLEKIRERRNRVISGPRKE